MKKFVFVALCMFVLLVFGGCFASVPVENPKTTVLQTKTETKTTKIVVKTTKKLPVYVQGSVKLNDTLDDFDFVATKRYVYYNIPGSVEDLVPKGTTSKLFSETNNSVEVSEMPLVTLIKYCNISKDEFVRAIENDRETLINHGIPLDSEDYELPNADIIYTFDNEIINEYYRRE